MPQRVHRSCIAATQLCCLSEAWLECNATAAPDASSSSSSSAAAGPAIQQFLPAMTPLAGPMAATSRACDLQKVSLSNHLSDYTSGHLSGQFAAATANLITQSGYLGNCCATANGSLSSINAGAAVSATGTSLFDYGHDNKAVPLLGSWTVKRPGTGSGLQPLQQPDEPAAGHLPVARASSSSCNSCSMAGGSSSSDLTGNSDLVERCNSVKSRRSIDSSSQQSLQTRTAASCTHRSTSATRASLSSEASAAAAAACASEYLAATESLLTWELVLEQKSRRKSFSSNKSLNLEFEAVDGPEALMAECTPASVHASPHASLAAAAARAVRSSRCEAAWRATSAAGRAHAAAQPGLPGQTYAAQLSAGSGAARPAVQQQQHQQQPLQVDIPQRQSQLLQVIDHEVAQLLQLRAKVAASHQGVPPSAAAPDAAAAAAANGLVGPSAAPCDREDAATPAARQVHWASDAAVGGTLQKKWAEQQQQQQQQQQHNTRQPHALAVTPLPQALSPACSNIEDQQLGLQLPTPQPLQQRHGQVAAAAPELHKSAVRATAERKLQQLAAMQELHWQLHQELMQLLP